MKKITIFLLSLILIIPIFSFFGCNALYEDAICKIGKKEYSSLAQAIVDCKEGETIKVYNDVEENINNSLFKESTFIANSSNNKVYVNYIINKPINIVGVKQNYKQPKIYGSFVTELSSSDSINKNILIYNVEIINNHISLTDNEQNKPFINAITINNGNVSIENCYIRQSITVENEILEENNISCLNGIVLKRKNNTPLDGQTLSYYIRNNKISGYNNYYNNQTSSAFSIINNEENYSFVYPCSINGHTENLIDIIELENKIYKNNTTLIQNFNYLTQKYSYLSTSNPNLIKQNNFEEDSEVEFLGQNFGYQNKTDFEVFGHLTFKNVKNINFIMKTASAKVTIKGSKSNISVVPYILLP